MPPEQHQNSTASRVNINSFSKKPEDDRGEARAPKRERTSGEGGPRPHSSSPTRGNAPFRHRARNVPSSSGTSCTRWEPASFYTFAKLAVVEEAVGGGVGMAVGAGAGFPVSIAANDADVDFDIDDDSETNVDATIVAQANTAVALA